MKIGLHLKSRQSIIFKLLTPKTIKVLGSTKNDENGPHLKINEVLLVDCKIVKNECLHDSRALYKFVLNKSFDQLLGTSPKISHF